MALTNSGQMPSSELCKASVANMAHSADAGLLLADLVREAALATAAATGKVAVTPPTDVSPVAATSTSVAVPPAPLLPAVGRACYTPHAMVELMLQRPDYTHAMLCAHFERPSSWLAIVLASEAFQQALDPYRNQITDPSLTASLQERYKALAIRTSNVMMQKLDDEKVTDFMVLKSGEIAMKALGMGTKTEAPPPPAAAPAATDSLAERLMAALDRRDSARTVDAAIDADEVSPDGNV